MAMKSVGKKRKCSSLHYTAKSTRGVQKVNTYDTLWYVAMVVARYHVKIVHIRLNLVPN